MADRNGGGLVVVVVIFFFYSSRGELWCSDPAKSSTGVSSLNRWIVKPSLIPFVLRCQQLTMYRRRAPLVG